MRLDSEWDREILLTLVETAVVRVSDAPKMLDLLKRVREADVESEEYAGPVITTTGELAKTH